MELQVEKTFSWSELEKENVDFFLSCNLLLKFDTSFLLDICCHTAVKFRRVKL